MTKPLPSELRRTPNRMNSAIVAVKPNGEVAAVYDNPSQAIKMAGVNSGNLYQCLLHKKKTAKGHMWYYKDEHMRIWFENPELLEWERDPNHTYFKRDAKKGGPGICKGKKMKFTPKGLENRRIATAKAHERMRLEGTYQRLAKAKCKRIVSRDTGIVYDSISERAVQIGVRPSTLSQSIKEGCRCRGEYYEYYK